MNWLIEYKKSLKNIHAEEPLDVYLYRPMAFIIVKALYSTSLTPNQYSLLALLSGIAAGGCFLQGTYLGLQWGGFFFLLFAILDCCDGMVARLKKNGTEFGRLIDGIVDYTVNMIVYITLALGMKSSLGIEAPIQVWVLVVLAGFSKAVHSISYDHYLSEYLAYEKGDSGFVLQEIKILKEKILNAQKMDAPIMRRIALRLYLGYSVLQAGSAKRKLIYDSKLYCEKNLLALRLWSLIGPTTHMTVLILSFLFGRPDVLFFYAIVFGNIWLLLMFGYQLKMNDQLGRKGTLR
ncbi:MAG: CDP-alcohol phosphatidyltransferase family protein [Bacteriovorax sp.]|jgi:phosphatidylglycerophosphate synthase|nr:CDP-alcohol phosphatidyltransferase family protein [Bacteriovorax sp.]